MHGFPDEVPLWAIERPESRQRPWPGDLESFIPQGFGLGAPAIITPYSGPPAEPYYGFQEAQPNPFLNGPLTEPCGGTLYFDDNAAAEALNAALQMMGVYQTLDYAALGASSADPAAERYLDQMRFISCMALGSVFGATGAGPPPRQTLNILQAAAAFVSAQKEKWNDGSTFSSKLSRTAGGDGDWAKESLAFGFHVENTYWGIYRIWSRAWLVTK